MEVRRNPLRELQQLRPAQHVLELRLPDQDRLQELHLVDVNVRQHAQAFERAFAQILRLVDDQDCPSPVCALAVEKILEDFQQARDRALKRQIERHHDPLQQLVAAARRVGDQADIDAARVEAATQQMTHERRLARAHLAGDDGELRIVHHAELEHGKGHAMRAAPIDQVGIGQNRERLFAQAVKRLVHQKSPTGTKRGFRSTPRPPMRSRPVMRVLAAPDEMCPNGNAQAMQFPVLSYLQGPKQRYRCTRAIPIMIPALRFCVELPVSRPFFHGYQRKDREFRSSAPLRVASPGLTQTSTQKGGG